MVKYTMIAVSVIVLTVGCTHRMHTENKAAGTQQSEAKLMSAASSLHDRKFRWMTEGVTDSLEMILHPDLMYIHSNGWTETKPELLQNIKSGKLTYHRVKVLESKTSVSGCAAVVTGKGIFNVSLDGKPGEYHLYYTEVYVSAASGLKLISRHACRLQP